MVDLLNGEEKTGRKEGADENEGGHLGARFLTRHVVVRQKYSFR